MNSLMGSEEHDPRARVVLDIGIDRSPSWLARDVEQAIVDLTSGTFAPVGLKGHLITHLSSKNGRLIFDIRDADNRTLRLFGLALGPFRKIVKDYMLLLESHALAIAEGRQQRLEAIDMGRRGLHNEGAAQMTERLRGKISIDDETARRLFTLVCVLQQR